MENYLLISVCDREITTKQFDSLSLAQNQMRQEMLECSCIKKEDLFNPDNSPKLENEDGSRFAISTTSAWVNDNTLNDWLIVNLNN